MSKAIFEKRVKKLHLNLMGALHGGNLMKWMDEAGGAAAYCHAECLCVTIRVDSFEFLRPVYEDEVLTIKASVNRAWGTSMEVGIKAETKSDKNGEYHRVASAYYVYVALNEVGAPVKIPEFTPHTDDEKRRWVEAGTRRERRLQEKRSRETLTKYH
jgi:acyl-CoA hydrolase